MIFIRNVS